MAHMTKSDLNKLHHWELKNLIKQGLYVDTSKAILRERDMTLEHDRCQILISHFALNSASCYLIHAFKIDSELSISSGNEGIGLITWLQDQTNSILESNPLDESQLNTVICVREKGMYWHIAKRTNNRYELVAISLEKETILNAPELSTPKLVLTAHVLNRISSRILDPMGYVENGGIIPWLLAKVFTNQVIENEIATERGMIEIEGYRFITQVDDFGRLRVITLIQNK